MMKYKGIETDKPPIKKTGPNGGARPGSGRPEFVPTDAERKQVEAMSGYGVPFEQIGHLVRGGIHIETLRSHFAGELASGKAKANVQVGKTLHQKCMDGDTTALIWWSKTQMRWSEKVDPVVVISAKIEDLTDAELVAELAEYGIKSAKT